MRRPNRPGRSWGPAWLATAALVTGCGKPPPPPTRAMAIELADAMDDAFNRGAGAEYGALFRPSSLHGASFARLRTLLHHDQRLGLRSELEDFRDLGTGPDRVGVALLRSTLYDTARRDDHRTVLHSYIAFQHDGTAPRVLLFEDVHADARRHLHDRHTGVFRCPPCNFRIGDAGLAEWLVVPSPRELTGCVETVSFFRPGEDLQLTFSVLRNRARRTAIETLQLLVDEPPPAGADPVVARGAVRAWAPPAYAAGAPGGIDAAACDLELAGGRVTELFAVAHRTAPARGDPDTLCYLLTVRGSADARARHAAEVATWLASFELIDPEQASDVVAFESAKQHSGPGTTLVGSAYHNAAYGVSCRGPEQWRASLRADACLFGVRYACPQDQGELQLIGYPPSPGTPAEQREQIAAAIDGRLQRFDLQIVADSGWVDGPPALAGALRARDLHARAATGDPARPSRRARVVLFEDFWLLVEGEIRAEAAESHYAALVDSLRR